MAEPALRNAVLLRGEEVLVDPAEMGLIVATAAYAHVHSSFHPLRARVGHRRDRAGTGEVDIVVTTAGGVVMAVEVKFPESLELGPRSGILQFLAGNPEVPSFLLTKRTRDMGPVPVRGQETAV